jgi:hypothetical protein
LLAAPICCKLGRAVFPSDAIRVPRHLTVEGLKLLIRVYPRNLRLVKSCRFACIRGNPRLVERIDPRPSARIRVSWNHLSSGDPRHRTRLSVIDPHVK